MDYKNYNPRAAALAQARTLLTDALTRPPCASGDRPVQPGEHRLLAPDGAPGDVPGGRLHPECLVQPG